MSVDPVETNPNNGASFNRYNYANNNPYKFTDPDGRYSCNGNASDCKNFDKAINIAKEASNSSKLTEGQRDALSASVNFFGEKGNSDVKVSFGDLKGDFGQINTDREGKGTVKFDLTAIGKKNPGESGLVSGLAMRTLHEGDHGVQS